jgi:UDP-N-acetylglucosamine--N-acetylmuramyl-(pentapeptide) pyrophosphoryl-undecaprenol N-acetylglucosamine transferase
VGTTRGLETRLVPEAGSSWSWCGRAVEECKPATRLRTMLDLPLGVAECVRILHEFKPQVVVGVGGYASGPGMLAAILLRVPTLAYEPNAVPGMTNRWLGRWVSAAAVNFAQTAKYFRNAEVTGVPVRPEIYALPPRPEGSAADAELRLLVTAGSQGARIFNEAMPKIAAELLAAVPGLTIMHQAGARNVETTRAAYAASGADPARWRVEAFLEDMPQQYAAADLVLARSGSTVAELCAAGRPSLLVPVRGGSGRSSAEERRGAARCQSADAAGASAHPVAGSSTAGCHGSKSARACASRCARTHRSHRGSTRTAAIANISRFVASGKQDCSRIDVLAR